MSMGLRIPDFFASDDESESEKRLLRRFLLSRSRRQMQVVNQSLLNGKSMPGMQLIMSPNLAQYLQKAVPLNHKSGLHTLQLQVFLMIPVGLLKVPLKNGLLTQLHRLLELKPKTNGLHTSRINTDTHMTLQVRV